MKHKDFLDFKPLAKQTISKVQKDVDDKKVNWLNMKWIQYRKSEPDFIYFKYDFDEQFKAIKIRRSGRNTPSIPCKFTGWLPISEQKKQDLLSLCHELIKPLEYHYFYENLPVESKIDKLPEPDAYEEDCDSDYWLIQNLEMCCIFRSGQH